MEASGFFNLLAYKSGLKQRLENVPTPKNRDPVRSPPENEMYSFLNPLIEWCIRSLTVFPSVHQTLCW